MNNFSSLPKGNAARCEIVPKSPSKGRSKLNMFYAEHLWKVIIDPGRD